MAVRYLCRHCQTELGTIHGQVHSEQLGLEHLTSEERIDMLTYEKDGTMTVLVICEDCHEALLRNPDFYQYDQLIQ